MPAAPRRRADAERSIAAILDAAIAVLGDRPDASMTDIATAAGVARQTVYAHYESRAALLSAVAARALERTLAAFEAAALDTGAPEQALARLTDAWWQTIGAHVRVVHALRSDSGSPAELHQFHEPILERVERLVARGQHAGSFDADLPANWLASAFLGLMHTTADEVATQRLDAEDAARALRRSVPRLFGVDAPRDR
jgi:AcrR family transcriptional regulator